jgi:hypothetical protein
MAIRRLMMMGLTNYIRSLIKTFETQVNSNQGQFEAEDCIYSTLDSLNKINLLESAYTILTPNSFFESEVAGLYPTITNTPIVNRLSYTNLFHTGWSNGFTSFSTVSLTNPFGGTYSNQVVETASSGVHYMGQSIDVLIGVSYTFSIYLKKGNGATSPDIMQLYFANNGFNATLCGNFNINTGVVTAQTGLSASIVSAGNSWWRCSITAAASSTSIATVAGITFVNNNASATKNPSYLGVITSNTYAYGAQVEVGTLTTYQEIDFTAPIVNNYAGFLRGSSLYTSRTNSLGVVETIPWNITQYSEDISFWTLNGVTSTQRAEYSPINTLTATRVIETTGNQTHFVNPTTVTLREIVPLTCSIYMKKGIGASASNWMQLTLINAAVAGTQRVNFNIDTGTVGTFSVVTTPIITDVGNGWWYCQATFIPATITSATNIAVYFTNNSSTAARAFSYTGNINSDVYLWGAQCVEGNTSLPYLPTTNRQNFPRLNYYDTNPNTIITCPTFLLESSITNLLLNSEVFSSTWITSNMTVTPDTAISPNGIQAGDTLTATSSNAYITQSAQGTTSNVARIFSVWLKRKTGSGNISLQSGDVSQVVTINSLSWTRCWITNNLMSGTYSSSGTSYAVTTTSPHGLITGDSIRFDSTSGSASDQSISSITVTSITQFTFTGTSATTSGSCIIISNSCKIIIASNGDEVYVWGAQLEASMSLNIQNTSNIIPTSYISTGTTTVTRSADTVIAKNPATSQVSFYVRIKRLAGTNNSASPFILFSDGSSTGTSINSIHCVGLVSGLINWYYRLNNSTVSLATNAIYSPDEEDFFTILITGDSSASYKFNIWMNGSLIISSTASIDISALRYTSFGLTQPTTFLDKYITWDRVLTNDEITALFSYPYYNTGYTTTNVELQHVINRAYAEGFTLPSTSTLAYCDTLITEMKNDGVWNLSDVYLNFAYNDTNLSGFSRINWKNPYGALGLATVFGTITLTTQGFSNDGTTYNYINTNFNPANIQANYTLNNAGRLFVIASDLTFIVSRYYDSANTSANRILRASTSNITINATTLTGENISTSGVGLKSLMRDDSTNVRFQNGSTVYNRTSTSTSVSNTTQVIGGQNGSASADAVYANYWMGGSLTNSQIDNFRTYYNQYLVNIGLTAFA